MRVFPEKPEWILVFSLGMTGSLDNFLSYSETAKTRMRTIKMLNLPSKLGENLKYNNTGYKYSIV